MPESPVPPVSPADELTFAERINARAEELDAAKAARTPEQARTDEEERARIMRTPELRVFTDLRSMLRPGDPRKPAPKTRRRRVGRRARRVARSGARSGDSGDDDPADPPSRRLTAPPASPTSAPTPVGALRRSGGGERLT